MKNNPRNAERNYAIAKEAPPPPQKKKNQGFNEI